MMYLDDTLTEQELQDTREEMRATHNPASNPHGIPWKGEADPRLIVAGDIIAIYAGNDHPQYTVTIEGKPVHDDFYKSVTFQTSAGEFVVGYGQKVWVAAYAPLLGD